MKMPDQARTGRADSAVGDGFGLIPDLVRQAVEGTIFRMAHGLRTPFVTWTYVWFRPIVVKTVKRRDSAPGVHCGVV